MASEREVSRSLQLWFIVGNVWAIDSTMVDSTRMIETPVDSTINQESNGK